MRSDTPSPDVLWFRLAVRSIGLFMVVWGTPSLASAVASVAYWLTDGNVFALQGAGLSWWMLAQFVGPGLQVGLGVYLLTGAKWLITYCCRGALGMCPACNYDVRNVPGATCPECGVGLPGRVPETPKS